MLHDFSAASGDMRRWVWRVRGYDQSPLMLLIPVETTRLAIIRQKLCVGEEKLGKRTVVGCLLGPLFRR